MGANKIQSDESHSTRNLQIQHQTKTNERIPILFTRYHTVISFLAKHFFRHNLSKTVNALLFAWKLDSKRETIIKTIEKLFFEIKIVWLIHPLKAKKSLLLHRLLSIFSVLVHVACFNNHFFFCFIFNCLCFSWVLWIMKVKKNSNLYFQCYCLFVCLAYLIFWKVLPDIIWV